VCRSVNILFSDGNMFDEAGFTGKRTGFGFENVSFGSIIFVSGAVLLGSMGIGLGHLAI
jgi:hypothetical protein